MKKQIFILIFIGFISQYAFSQISEGGTPVSFSLDMINARMSELPVLVMPSVNVKALQEEDARISGMVEDELIPFRFGYAIDVDIDIKRDGVRTDLPNGSSLWMLKIHSAEAYSINLIFNRFRLSERSKFGIGHFV